MARRRARRSPEHSESRHSARPSRQAPSTEVSIAVTGTPIENRLRDLWSIMDFVLPGYLGDLPAFEARYTDNDEDASSLEPLVSPVILRRRVQEVAQDLPPRIDIPEILELEDDEAIAYDDVRATIHRKYGAAATLVALTKLRQFCAHPALLGNTRSFTTTRSSTAQRHYLAKCSRGGRKRSYSRHTPPWPTGSRRWCETSLG